MLENLGHTVNGEKPASQWGKPEMIPAFEEQFKAREKKTAVDNSTTETPPCLSIDQLNSIQLNHYKLLVYYSVDETDALKVASQMKRPVVENRVEKPDVFKHA